MAVSSYIYTIVYTTAGRSASYNIPYYFMQQQDLLVQGRDASGHITTYHLNNDYNIIGTPNLVGNYPNGAVLSFNPNSIPPDGTVLSITRVTNRTNNVTFVNNQPLVADVLNQQFDQLFLLCQEGFIAGYQGVGFGPPTTTDVYYNVGDWIKNITPVPGDVFGWICTTAGNPGSWQAWGPIGLAF